VVKAIAVAFTVLLALGPSGVAGPRAPGTQAAIPPTTAAPPPPGSVGPLPTGSPPPSTIPLTTKGQSAHISPIFPVLSGVGVAVVLLVFGTQWVLTRRGRRRGWTL
jgi:hypothetical protein